MALISILIFGILAIVSVFHFYWAFGGIWPGHDEPSLTRTVIGANGVTEMPPMWLTAIVAIAIFIAGLFPLMWSGMIPYPLPQFLVWLAMWGLTLVFLGRGLSGYLPFFRNANSEQPFADLDRKFFSPLCIVLGLAFLGLIYLAGK